MSKRKRVGKIVSRILLFLLFFLLILLIRSADWFLETFQVDFSVAIYQLFSPLKGTEAGVLDDFVEQCLNPAIFLALVGVLAYTICDMAAGRIFIETQIRIGKKQLCFGGKWRKRAVFGKHVVLWLSIAALCADVWSSAVAVGIPDYVEEITNASTIFEEKYKDPKSVTITFPEKKRNLIVLYIESMEATYASTEDGGGKPVNLIPELTQLAAENVSFSNDEDLGGAGAAPRTGWTMGALFASATGVPFKLPVHGNTAGDYESFAPGLTGLGEVLSENGYQNYFMCGSEAVFGGRQAFYEQHGDYCILDYVTAKRDGIIPEDYHEFWGMEDLKLYEYAKQQLPEIAKRNEPFNFMMLTVDTHPDDGYVCAACPDTYERRYENVVACASRQAVEFIDWVSQQDWYENTTIVVTGDHLNMKSDFWDDIGNYDRRIYNCFINLPEGVTPVNTTNREFNVLDMFPTILTSIGADVEGDRLAMGTNLFSAQKTLYEEMGKELCDDELKKYSNYYYQHFVIGKP